MEMIIPVIIGFSISMLLAIIVSYFVRKGPKIEYFPEHDQWFGVSEEKEKPKEPIKRKLDV